MQLPLSIRRRLPGYKATMKFVILSVFLAFRAVLFGSEVTYVSPAAGISLVKPASWHLTAMDLGKSDCRLDDAALASLLKPKRNIPLVTITKYPEPYDDVNPSFLLSIEPMGKLKGRTAQEILQVIKSSLARTFSNFEVRRNVGAMNCGGLPGADMEVRYLFKTAAGKELASQSRMICLPRGDFFIQITTATAPDPDSATQDALNGIIAALKVQE
jgi:hypothetical protein